MNSRLLVCGAILFAALLLFLAFPTRLPLNLELSVPEPNKPPASSEFQTVACDATLYLTQNLGRGQYLQISDGFYYEVAPEDIRLAAFWIGPAPVAFCYLDDLDYPVQITNSYSGISVRVKLTSYEEIQDKIARLQAAARPMPPAAPSDQPPVQQQAEQPKEPAKTPPPPPKKPQPKKTR
jgi:hypothetical protein